MNKQTMADPLIYRFHEVTGIYGSNLKEVLHFESK